MPDPQQSRSNAARIGLLNRVMRVRRAQAPDGEPPAPPREPEPTPEPPAERERVAALEARVSHLEAELEGLQDAVHRQVERQDERLRAAERRLDPAALAKALSDDARERGL